MYNTLNTFDVIKEEGGDHIVEFTSDGKNTVLVLRIGSGFAKVAMSTCLPTSSEILKGTKND